MVFPSITPGLGYYAAGSEPVNSAQGDPAEILENKGQTPRLEGAPVPLPAAHLAPGGKALETPACQRVHTSFELCTEKRIFVMPITF
jgi:hypothetical protein